jgi:hypothetical protein
MVPVFLSGSASALTYGKMAITGNVPLDAYNLSVSGIDKNNATVTWMTNGNADSTVEYGTSANYGSNSTNGAMAESHTIYLIRLLPGTVYHYQVISADLAGNIAVSPDSNFTTTAIPVTVTPTAQSGGGGSGRGGGNGNSGLGPESPQAAPQQANPFGQSLLAPLEQLLQAGPPESLFSANNPGNTAPAVYESYPMGFLGLIYNANDEGTLSINMAAAQAAGATITVYTDHVVVYQHHSPGVLMTFWGTNLRVTNGTTITGPVSWAEFVTDPLNATLEIGNVSSSVHAVLPRLIQRIDLKLSISENLSMDTLNQFQDITSRNNLQLDAVAYTFDVQNVNLTTVPVNVTFTIPTSWVNEHGGKDAVRIIHISKETGKQELIDPVYGGVDAQGNMIFRGDAQNDASLFALVTVAQNTYLNSGMFVWPLHMAVLIGGIALLVVIAYFGWWKRRV